MAISENEAARNPIPEPVERTVSPRGLRDTRHFLLSRSVSMPTNAKTKTKRAAQRKSQRSHAAVSGSAIALLKKDHREVKGYFEEYEELKADNAKAELAKKICMALKVHTQIEEQIFYPAARKATGDNDLLDEALVEHAGAKNLIAEIESMEVGDDLYDAKITVLGEQIKYHVKEEEELFPEIEDSKMDVVAVGKQMAARKTGLMAQLGMSAEAK
jgi:hemerythrin HHE cation binding domain-containing protein